MITSKLVNVRQHQPDVICGKTCYDLPVKSIESLSSRIVSAYTGPGPGLISVNVDHRSKAFQVPPEAEVAFIDEEDEDDEQHSSGPVNKSNNSGTVASITTKSTKFKNGEAKKVSESERTTTTTTSSEPTTPTSTTSLPSLDEIAGVRNWYCPTDNAFGLATTLYESHPTTKERAGEPIADSFGICVRENSAILALADGVNWGQQACTAARSAIHGSMEYLNKALYKEGGGRVTNTMDVFVSLLRSFSAAHNLILQENGKLTTLTVAVIVQLKNSDKFVVCSCNVGDSFAYVYSKQHGVREITQGSHDIFSMRDMRSALGALGPVDGNKPELNNLTVAMTIVDQGDIVFLASDGISDNFDPVVGKFAIPKKPEKPSNGEVIKSTDNNNKSNFNGNVTNGKSCEKVATKNKINSKLFCTRSNSVKSTSNHSHSRRKSEGLIARLAEDIKNPDKSRSRVHNNNQPSKRAIPSKEIKLKRCNSIPDRDHHRYSNPLPVVTAVQRHELTLLRMEDLICNGLNQGDTSCTTAKQLCELMVDFASKLTSAKRHILEDPELYDEADPSFEHHDQRQRRRRVGDKLVMVPGKLDHASIVACKISFYGDFVGKKYHPSEADINKYNLKLKATLAKIDLNED